ncbi:NAD-dependent deacylase [Bacteroidales bacterium OttesenSCG-928-B11]|nr:NAD-dependent deacylase [Bacteroidales bacterium OttesenSCG-928-E04]MDL2311913.1 NAD-dependent deacylase [Bacteroidales bacterium OttesenSCG-928-B11]
MKKLVFLTGAGISAESGISTFRDSDGLWERHRIEDVASIEGWHRNPELVNDFYNKRRTQLSECEPNAAHQIIAELENLFDVTVITQNVDNLHEKAGSSRVIHLHGELTKACSENQKGYVTDIGFREIVFGEKAPDGHLLRPFIVWFGEEVPLMEFAMTEVESADYLVIIGTSLNVYPAAGLYHYAKPGIPIWLIDPNETQPVNKHVKIIREKATKGMDILKKELIND